VANATAAMKAAQAAVNPGFAMIVILRFLAL
jgi:hypothetical protein